MLVCSALHSCLPRAALFPASRSHIQAHMQRGGGQHMTASSSSQLSAHNPCSAQALSWLLVCREARTAMLCSPRRWTLTPPTWTPSCRTPTTQPRGWCEQALPQVPKESLQRGLPRRHASPAVQHAAWQPSIACVCAIDPDTCVWSAPWILSQAVARLHSPFAGFVAIGSLAPPSVSRGCLFCSSNWGVHA